MILHPASVKKKVSRNLGSILQSMAEKLLKKSVSLENNFENVRKD